VRSRSKLPPQRTDQPMAAAPPSVQVMPSPSCRGLRKVQTRKARSLALQRVSKQKGTVPKLGSLAMKARRQRAAAAGAATLLPAQVCLHSKRPLVHPVAVLFEGMLPLGLSVS
jgi:hypothetical protein